MANHTAAISGAKMCQQRSEDSAATTRQQLTFYQPHLCQFPHLTFFNDIPPHNSLQDRNSLNSLQITKIHQRPHCDGSKQSPRCSTTERDSNESVIDLEHVHLDELPVPVEEITAPKGFTQHRAPEDTKEPLTYIKFIEKCTFIPPKSNASQESERKPTKIERGYILWELESTGNEVLRLETKMERVVEELAVRATQAKSKTG